MNLTAATLVWTLQFPSDRASAAPEYLRLLSRYSTTVRELALATRKVILEAAPEANEFVYEVYTIADHFTLSDRPSDAFVFTTTHTSWVNLGFNFGARLPDPHALLRGDGKLMRHARIAEATDLELPGLHELIRAAIAQVDHSECAAGEPRTVIHKRQSVKKQRPAIRLSTKRGS